MDNILAWQASCLGISCPSKRHRTIARDPLSRLVDDDGAAGSTNGGCDTTAMIQVTISCVRDCVSLLLAYISMDYLDSNSIDLNGGFVDDRDLVDWNLRSIKQLQKICIKANIRLLIVILSLTAKAAPETFLEAGVPRVIRVPQT